MAISKGQVAFLLFVIGVLIILDALLSIATPAVGHYLLADLGRVLRFILGAVLIYISYRVYK